MSQTATAVTTSLAASCLRDEDVFLLLGGAKGAALESLRAHLDACEACQELVALAASSEETNIVDGDTILDRYQVLGELGRGGMGVVYRVHDAKLHRDLAIKILHSADPSAPLRLEREAQALARLSHPNIVTVFDIGGLRDQVCMVMELVEGASLRTWLERERSRDETLRTFRRAGEGLHAAHRAGLIHRDFKPENVLVCDDGRVKIVDFGLAANDVVASASETLLPSNFAHSQTLQRLTRTGGVVGTPAYMAPEQFRGVEADARSDQFSFAVCLWEAIRGQHPFLAPTLSELRQNLERGPAGVTDAVRRDPTTRTLLRALSVDPAARFASMAELLGELDDPERPGRSHARSGGVVLALVAGGLIAGASVLILGRTSGPADALARARPPPVASLPAAPSAPFPAVVPDHDAGAAATPEPRVFRRPPNLATVSSRPVKAPTVAPIASAPLRGPNGAPLIE